MLEDLYTTIYHKNPNASFAETDNFDDEVKAMFEAAGIDDFEEV